MAENQVSCLFTHASGEAMYGRGAVLSECTRYRYRLWRIWDDDLAPTAFVMLNPSTADASADDPTIRRCVGFAKRWGAGGIVVVNLFAFRATDPEKLVEAHANGVDVVGPEAAHHLDAVFSVADVVVCAWGAHPIAGPARIAHVLGRIPRSTEVVCLGKTQGGAPRHPLYLRKDSARVLFEVTP